MITGIMVALRPFVTDDHRYSHPRKKRIFVALRPFVTDDHRYSHLQKKRILVALHDEGVGKVS